MKKFNTTRLKKILPELLKFIVVVTARTIVFVCDMKEMIQKDKQNNEKNI